MDWERLPTITANRLSLRWISAADIEDLFSIFSNGEVMRYWSTPPLADIAGAKKLLAEIHEGFQHRTLLKWGVALRSNDKLVGTTTLYSLDFDNRRCELGYALGRIHWGNGYMQEALNATLGFAFGDLDMRRIEADVDPRNAASIRTLERLGFQREGFLRERWQVNGEIQDALFYGLLRPEWNCESV